MVIDEILIAIIYMQMYVNIALVAIVMILCIILLKIYKTSNEQEKTHL